MRIGSHDHAPRSALRSGRSGFTLAECIVAAVLLTVGLLGLAGTALAVQRLASGAAWRAEAAALGWARLERLRALPCASRSGGAAPWPLAEAWSVASAAALTFAADSLALPPSGGSSGPPVVVAAALPCR